MSKRNGKMKYLAIGAAGLIAAGGLALDATYQIQEQEQAVLTTFGVPKAVNETGLHFKVPFVQQVQKVNTTIQGFPIGYSMGNNAVVENEGIMITSDYNFIDVDFFVEYRISEPVKYLYTSEQPEEILKNIAQSCIRTVIASYNVDEVLTTGKGEIQSKIKEMILNQMEEQDLGIQLVNITIQDSEPPTEEVMKAFKEVETAKQGKETALNNANKYRNEKLPEAQAQADQIIQDADDQKIKVAMDIRFSNIANYVDDVGIGAHGYCYIEDTDGNIVYHPQQQLIYSGLKKENARGEDGVEYGEEAIYTTRTLSESKWRIVGVCYVDEMVTNKVEDMVLLLILILIIVLIGTLFVGSLISNIFAKPVKKLTQAMRSFEKNAENYTYQQVGGTEEIVELSRSFEHMVVRIQKLMEKVRREEITLRKTELKALQAQINPHFLYNTLDAIAWLCEDGRSQDAEDMVTSLAKLFRISISKGHELITIEKEIQHAESYLRIQKFRYKNQFTYHFDVDEECLGYLCNKITLQPIIENAIYHGINRMVDEGEILIEVHQDQDDIILAVEDNGVGMTEEQCQEIMKKERGDRTGIGIKNVNDRIISW